MTKEQRHRCMSHIRSKDTSPEMRVRRQLFAMGYRYRLHVTSLPGKPDIVLPKYKKVIFVHGCFWHGHDCLAGRKPPQTNKKFWKEKFLNNKARDKRTLAKLFQAGWETLVIWECETTNSQRLFELLSNFLPPRHQKNILYTDIEPQDTYMLVAESINND